MAIRIDPDNDPNEAYEVAPVVPRPHGPPASWWQITCNGFPVGAVADRAAAVRYATDPAFRLAQQEERDRLWRIGHPDEPRRP